MPENYPRRRRPANDPASDIERFLAEVDRLRRKAATEPKRPVEEERYDEVEEVLPAQPPPRPRPKPRPRYVEADEVVEVLPVRPAPSVVEYAPTPARPPVKQAPAAPAPVQAVQAVKRVKEAGALASRSVNPTAQRMLTLLQPENIRASFMLREVLGPPLSKRRRR
jgi:hypothetical protein